VALVALQVFVRPAPSAARGMAAVRPAAASPGTAVAAAPVRVTAPTPARSGPETAAFVAQRLVLLSPTESHNTASLVIVAGRDPVRPLPTAEAAPRSPRPSIEQFVFEQPSTGNDNLPTLHIRQSADAQTEMAAYQFQR
jgi:hypothetical protein